MQWLFKRLLALAASAGLAAHMSAAASPQELDKAIKAQFTKTTSTGSAVNAARLRLSAVELQKLEDWLAQAEGKGLTPIDHNDPRDREGLDLLRRLGGYPTRSTYLSTLASLRSPTAVTTDPACKAFLAEYQSNGLFLDLGQKDGKLMATVLQANAHANLPRVRFASMIQVIDSDKNPVTSGDGLGHDKPVLVTYAPPAPGAYRPHKPPRAAVEFTVFKEDGTPCSYRDVKAMMPWPQTISVKAPNNTRSNSRTVLCLNRSHPDKDWPGGCDFGPFPQAKHETGWAVIVPQEGEILLQGPVATKADGSVDADLQVTAINSQNGTTCQGQDVDVGKSVLAATKIDPKNPNKISWSLLGDKAPTFGQTCYDAHSGLHFNMFWNIRVKSGAKSQGVNAIVSNTLTQGSYSTLIVPDVDLQFGCLPGGTLVTMANGDRKPIEKIVNGELVLGADGKPWEVWSRMAGDELSLVQIVAADGSTVSASETHPVIVGEEPDGRPRALPASQLKTGMPLKTSLGKSTVASVTKIAYDGHVYNLAIRLPGVDKQAPEGGNFYADGILVGDQTMQGKATSITAQANSASEQIGRNP